MRVAETEDFDRVTLSLLGEKGFAKPLFVFGDNGIGGGKNMSGGAEILLETDLEGIRKVAGETADVSDVAPAPAIDRLVIVADDEETFNGATSRVIRFIALAENTIALNRVCLTFRACRDPF